MRKLRILAVLFLLLVGAGGGAYVYFEKQLQTPHASTKTAGKPFEIPSGLGARGVLKLLHEKDVIADEDLALAYLAVSGTRKELKAGEYLFDKPMTIPEVVEKLSEGSVYLHRFTVPEGLTVAETSGYWEAQGFGKAEEFVQAANSSAELVRDLGGNSLEGYLFPETYSFPIRTTPKKAIEAMVARFRVVLDEVKKKSPQNTWPLGVRETLILASLIEEEAKLDEERPLVASVFENRLKKKILLQCDPTIIYALEQSHQYRGRLLTADLKVDTPYNTYRYEGLPPGPISNPGRRSLEAAAQPAKTAYLYFVRTTDNHHTFSDNLAAHNRAVAAYRVLQKQK